MKLDFNLSLEKVSQQLPRFWELSGQKIRSIETTFDTAKGAPVFTENGTYVTRGWTEWTQGFQFGSAILQFDATGDAEFLEIGRKNTLAKMAPHLTHIGVHDHGFNNVSTYGNLLRLILEGKIEENNWEKEFYKLAPQGNWSSAGYPMDKYTRWRIYLFLQRPTFPFCGYDP